MSATLRLAPPPDDEQLAELDAALAHARARVDDVLDVTADHFPLPTLGAPIAARTSRRARQRAGRGR